MESRTVLSVAHEVFYVGAYALISLAMWPVGFFSYILEGKNLYQFWRNCAAVVLTGGAAASGVGWGSATALVVPVLGLCFFAPFLLVALSVAMARATGLWIIPIYTALAIGGAVAATWLAQVVGLPLLSVGYFLAWGFDLRGQYLGRSALAKRALRE